MTEIGNKKRPTLPCKGIQLHLSPSLRCHKSPGLCSLTRGFWEWYQGDVGQCGQRWLEQPSLSPEIVAKRINLCPMTGDPRV